MQIKKSPKADLQNQKGLFLEIGLIISLLITIGAFLYAPKEYRIEQVDLNYGPIEEEITEITRNEQKPPEAPKKVEIKVFNDILDIVTNDSKITTEVMTFDEFEEGMEIETTVVEVEEEEIEEDQPFIKVEKMPTFRGGDLNQFRNWVQGRLRYPQIAQENGISGRVTLTFVIEKDGTLTNIEVMQSPDRSLSEEAIRVLNTSPKWEPGKQRNQPVRVRFTLPVAFQIRN
jgi:protein TonB